MNNYVIVISRKEADISVNQRIIEESHLDWMLNNLNRVNII